MVACRILADKLELDASRSSPVIHFYIGLAEEMRLTQEE